MAITYSAQAGTTITTFAMNETLPSSQPSNLLQVRVSNDIVTAGNGQIGDGTYGVGNSYVGRLLVINLGGTEQRRMCVAETDEGTTFLLTVHEEWDSQPVGATDTIHVCYEIADIEDGGAGGGIAFSPTDNVFSFSNDLTIANGGGLQNCFGIGVVWDDNPPNVVVFVQSGGHYYSGYQAGGKPVDGGMHIAIPDTVGDASVQFQSGSEARIYAAVFWSREASTQFECANGSDVLMDNVFLFTHANELILYDANLTNVGAPGAGLSTDICRVDAGTVCDGLNLSRMDALDSAADTVTETIELKGVLFTSMTNILTVRNNKTWNLINPIWDVTLYSDLDDAAVTGSATVNDRRAVVAIVQEPDGTKLQNALVNVYEHTQLADLVLELTTDSNGLAEDSFLYRAHVWTTGTGATTTYGGHALQCGKWLYLPFVAVQASDEEFDGVIVLADDSNIVQTTQATAKSAGSSITWNEDTNPSELFGFTDGAGTALVGMIVTFDTSGAVGTITELVDGDSSAGTIHLKDRNATAITNGETFGRTGGTPGTFGGTHTSGSQQSFSIWIDCQTLSLQAVYDYLAAIQNETTLTADGEKIWEWCRSAQTQPVYASGSSFYTEQSNSKGIFLVDAGTGTIDYMTDDTGTQYVPPTSTTLSITVKDASTLQAIQNAQCSIYLKDSPFTQLMNEDSLASGIASEPYTWTSDVDIVWKVRKSDDLDDPRYFAQSGLDVVTVNGFSITVLLEQNPFI